MGGFAEAPRLLRCSRPAQSRRASRLLVNPNSAASLHRDASAWVSKYSASQVETRLLPTPPFPCITRWMAPRVAGAWISAGFDFDIVVVSFVKLEFLPVGSPSPWMVRISKVFSSARRAWAKGSRIGWPATRGGSGAIVAPDPAFVARRQFVAQKRLAPVPCGWPLLCGGIASYRNSKLHALLLRLPLQAIRECSSDSDHRPGLLQSPATVLESVRLWLPAFPRATRRGGLGPA